METRHYWEENGLAVKYENYNTTDDFTRTADQLNFAAPPSEDEADYPAGGFLKKGKQDPMSHRIIEKRRRDRMNNCLADLSRLIPPEYLKKGRGRVEKTEIIEMAIKHIKYLQERANGLYQTNMDKSEYVNEKLAHDTPDHYKAGFQEAISESVKFLVETQGYDPGDGICVQMTSYLQRHYNQLAIVDQAREKIRSQIGSSSETASSSSSSYGYAVKAGVIARVAPPPEPSKYHEHTEPVAQAEPVYHMECDRVSANATPVLSDVVDRLISCEEPLPLDVRQNRESNLRTVRKPEANDDYLHSYKFKNSIERRFSKSQDHEIYDMSLKTSNSHPQSKFHSHKRRRAAKIAPSTSTSNSGSTEDALDTSPQAQSPNNPCSLTQQDTSSDSPAPHNHYEKPTPQQTQYVPVFALNSLGKYYVPLSVDYACLARHLGPYDVLDARAAHLAAPLHPVTIHVNFQPFMNYHVKREPSNGDWRAM